MLNKTLNRNPRFNLICLKRPGFSSFYGSLNCNKQRHVLYYLLAMNLPFGWLQHAPKIPQSTRVYELHIGAVNL